VPLRVERQCRDLDTVLASGWGSALYEMRRAWEPAELGRLQCRRDFVFAAEWNGVFYPTKQVRPIFVDEPSEIVVLTVYVYHLSGERR